MPKLTCDCGAERFFTVDELRAAAGTPFECPSCGTVRKLPLLPVASAAQPNGQAAATNHLDNLFAEIEAVAVDQSAPPPPAPLSPLAAAVQQEMEQESGILLLELWAIAVVLACYLLSATAIVFGIIAYRRADSSTQEIFAVLCWLFALVALCGGCSIQILLEICRRVKQPGLDAVRDGDHEDQLAQTET
jgi:hypothetical protein